MLAPLLPYLDVINVRVHYTGTEPLHAAAYTNPRPLRSTSQLPRRTRSSDAGGKEKAVRLRSEPRRLRPLVDSAAQYSAVWVLSFAALFWLMVCSLASKDTSERLCLPVMRMWSLRCGHLAALALTCHEQKQVRSKSDPCLPYSKRVPEMGLTKLDQV